MKVVIIYDSANDVPFMEPARSYLKGVGVIYEETILSVHQHLDELIVYLSKLEEKGEKVVTVSYTHLTLPTICSV